MKLSFSRGLRKPMCLGILATFLLLAQNVLGQWAIPDEHAAKVGTLTDTQIEFISSGAILAYIPERQVEHEIATRDEAGLSALITELMSLAVQMGYQPETDMGAIPLNLNSKRFNLGMQPTPAPLREMKREPGPFSVDRYLNPASGVNTFGGAKVAIWPEDLTAGNVDVAIIGIPSNFSSGRRDASMAPFEMRALDTIATPDIQSLVKPFDVLNIVDYGNFRADRLSVELTVPHVTTMVAETAATGAIPVMVGGDTSMLYPGVRGIARERGNGTFGLLHFSAHPDVERQGDHFISDTQAIFRLLDQEIVKGSETIQVGLRGPGVDVETLTWLRSRKVRYHTMAEIQQAGFDKVMKRVHREVEKGPDAFFVSVDVSVIDPTEMIGAGRAVSGGMHLWEVTKSIRYVCAAKQIVGFEITDLAPMLDLSHLSVTHANALLNACLVGMAVRKAGLDPDYVHPLALDHGQ